MKWKAPLANHTTQKIIITIEPHAQITIYNTPTFVEYVVGEYAHVTFIQHYDTVCSEINYIFTLAAYAQLDLFIAVTACAQLVLEVNLNGQHAHSKLHILGLIYNKENFSLTTRQLHNAPDTQSSVITKSIVRDAARSTYHGTIIINRDAHKTIANQESYALVMDALAAAQAIPALEILTNDVQCRHGSAIGYLTDEKIMYAVSRGLSVRDAEYMIMQGFLEELLQKCADPKIRATITASVQAKLIKQGKEHEQSS